MTSIFTVGKISATQYRARESEIYIDGTVSLSVGRPVSQAGSQSPAYSISSTLKWSRRRRSLVMMMPSHHLAAPVDMEDAHCSVC